MSTVMNVFNHAYISRAETCYGPCGDPILSINLIIKEKSCMEPASCSNGWNICVNQEKCYSDDCGYKPGYEDGYCNYVDKEGEYNSWRNKRSHGEYGCRGKFIPAPGFRIDVLEVMKLYREAIGDRWNYRTLVEYGGETRHAPFPIEYVEFSPSTENIAIYVYEVMKPLLASRMNAELLEVEIQSTHGTIWHSGNEYDG